MSFRTRLTIAFLAAVLLPLLALMVVLRGETRDRLTTEYQTRVDDVLEIIQVDLATRKTEISNSLSDIADDISNDNAFRSALQSRTASGRRYVVDYAQDAIELTNLSTLYILSGDDVVLSSGHFRNEFDRVDRGISDALERSPERFAFMEIRLPDTTVVTLSTLHTVDLGERALTLVGGTTVDDEFTRSLQRTPDVSVSLNLPGSDSEANPPVSVGQVSSKVGFPYIPLDRADTAEASIGVTHNTSGLVRLHRRLDRWFLAVGISSIFGAFLLAWLLASRISKPIQDVSARARRLDLDHLNVNFHSSRADEIGDLSRTLSSMTSRLRKSRREIVEMERKAAIGDLARQVNHDIRNGLTPIRNIVRYLDESAGDETSLKDAFKNRKQTLDSSISYLYELASNYAKLSSPGSNQEVDLGKLLSTIVEDARAAGFSKIKLEQDRAARLRPVNADPLSLRRIFENLVNNAIDSIQSETINSDSGSVIISVSTGTTHDRNTIQIDIADQGSGIDQSHLDKIFDDFYTTKATGTGLGLSIVRRLVMDLNGTISVASTPGEGSTFTVILPTVSSSS